MVKFNFNFFRVGESPPFFGQGRFLFIASITVPLLVAIMAQTNKIALHLAGCVCVLSTQTESRILVKMHYVMHRIRRAIKSSLATVNALIVVCR